MKSTLLFVLVIASVSAFTITDQSLQGVNWPFATCGTWSTWSMKNLTLGSTSTRNTNDSIDAVILI